MTRPVPRVVLVELATPGASVVLARMLRDAGVEVVYAGSLVTPDQVTRTVDQEDPDLLGVAIDPGVDPTVLSALADALPDIRLFAVGDEPDGGAGLENVFSTAEKAAEWVSGGRTHTGKAQSDLVR